MKPVVMTAALILSLPYLGAFLPGSAGNPNRDPAFGQPGSTYDAAANPPRTIGVVTYNPLAPLPPTVAPQLGPSGSASPRN